MSFQDCISSALKQGEITKEEAVNLVRRFKVLEEAEKGVKISDFDASASSNLRVEFAKNLRNEAVEKQRIQLLAAKAAGQIVTDFDSYKRVHGKDNIIRASYALFENFGNDGMSSVRGIYNALLGSAHAEMNEGLHNFRRSALTRERFNRPMLNDIPEIAFGGKGSPEATAFYNQWKGVSEKLRGLFNEAGGHIGELKDWGLPQSHNAQAMLNAGFEKWRDFISPKLAWDKMKHGVSEASILPSERENVLRAVFESRVTDGLSKHDLFPKDPQSSMISEYRPNSALYNRRNDARFLIFKGAEDWHAYSREFGKGEVFAAMMDHVRSMSKDVAMMQRLGPNPAATVEWLKDIIRKDGARMKIGEPYTRFPETKPILVNASVTNASRTLDGFYDVARGSGVPYTALGTSLNVWRNVQYAAKLGGAVILHTFSNPVIQAMGRYLHGHPVLSTPLDVLRNLGRDPHELHAAGMIMQDAMNTLERGAREQGALMRAREMSNWLPSITTHYSGLEAMVEANRRSAFLTQMTGYAKHLSADFNGLPDRTRNVLKGFGLTKDDWAVMQKAIPHQPEDGVPMLRYQDIASAQGVDPARANAVAMKYLELLHQSTEVMVPSSNWRVRATTSQIGRDGTLAGEVVKSAMMFKGGFMATFMITQMQGIAREIATHGKGAGAAYVGASVIALTVGGMLTLAAKQLRSGKDVPNMDITTKEGLKTWEAAFLTSGALGIYGDFIHSDRSSYGHNMIATLAGPMVTGAEDAFHGIKDIAGATMAKLGGGHGKAPNPTDNFVKFMQNNTPVLSTHWLLSGSYNRIILDQLHHMSDPQSHEKMRRMEQKLMKETGQQYWWRPGQAKPDRFPGFTTAR